MRSQPEEPQIGTLSTAASGNLAILGSTGSIGTQILSALEHVPELRDRWSVYGLAAGGKRLDLLAQQIQLHNPRVVVVTSAEQRDALIGRMPSTPQCEWLWGESSLEDLAGHADVHGVCVSIPGAESFAPAARALANGKCVALASKEALVAGGEWLMPLHRKNGMLWPVDSEHSAIHQLLTHRTAGIKKIVLTASGGPFRQKKLDELDGVTPAMACRHPNWNMGPRISVDSATLMNKAFEWIEAQWLFGEACPWFEVWIHPQSVVHGLIQWTDGSMVAHLGPRDMRHAIAYALSQGTTFKWELPSLELKDLAGLEFLPVDTERFPALRLAHNAHAVGGLWPAVLELADSMAVLAFLECRLPFRRIVDVVEEVLQVFSMDLPSAPQNLVPLKKEVERCFQGVLARFAK